MAVRVADTDLVNEQLGRFYQQVIDAVDVPMIRIKMDASAIAFVLINEADSWLKQGRTKAHEAFNEAYSEIQALGTIEDIVKVLKNFSFTIINLIEDTRLFHHRTIIHKAMVFIETNYQNKELSLDQTARAAGVSQSHLSFLFKKKINSSFNKYLTRIRIEHAIQLLKENDFKTYEVADMVGYNNAQYFSVSFKKYTGVSPLQYRNESDEIKIPARDGFTG
ncbi:MAG: AraC family transcriptional regulator [Treponema sp.]|jgi:two-component system response regulator YesN|nr:AraC family transcriptional regulator [Treponema sp.]